MGGAGKEDEDRDDWFEVMGLGWDATADDVKDGMFVRVCVMRARARVAWGGSGSSPPRLIIHTRLKPPHSVQEAGAQVPPRCVGRMAWHGGTNPQSTPPDTPNHTI